MHWLWDLGRLGQPLDHMGEGILIERLVIASGSDAREEDPAGARAAPKEATQLPAQVGREADQALLIALPDHAQLMATARQFEQVLLAHRGDLAGPEAGFAHDPDDQVALAIVERLHRAALGSEVGEPGVTRLPELGWRLAGHDAQLTGSDRHFPPTLAAEVSSGKGSPQRGQPVILPRAIFTIGKSLSGVREEDSWNSRVVLVERIGFEPTTSSVRGRRSPSCAIAPP